MSNKSPVTLPAYLINPTKMVLPNTMLEFDVAQSKLISAGHKPNTTESCPLSGSNGRVLAQDIVATLDLPPADNSAMDGYAIREIDYKPGETMAIQQRCYAGDTPEALKPGQAIRLFTGSVMPEGADCVVMQEYVDEVDDTIVIKQAPQAGDHVRKQGEDVTAGTTLFTAGTVLGPGEIALIASQGIAELTVYPQLKIGLLTTGDELVEPGQARAPEQIFNSNAPMLAAMLNRMGVPAYKVQHARDDEAEIRHVFQSLLSDCDLILTVGGVSVGDKDLIKPTITSLGGELNMWRVRMKPGRPVALAHINDIPIVGLPGNPVSAFVVFCMLVAPLIRTMQGRSSPLPDIRYGQLTTPREFHGSREEFLRVQAHHPGEGMPQLIPHTDQGSAIINSLSWASALARIPANTSLQDGDIVSYIDITDCLS